LSKLKYLLCFGTRPEAIKMAPVCRELKRANLDHKICVTAQHREMLDQVLTFFEIMPDFDLDLMQADQSLNELSAKIFLGIDKIFIEEDPEVVLVQGDTTTAAIIALAAFNRGIKVGHIEAGLRTYNKKAPFPEEINRQLIARIADIHFATTHKAENNLLKEHILKEHIVVTGNTVVDAIFWAKEKMANIQESEEIGRIKKFLNKEKKLILVTGHRRENFGEGIVRICDAIKDLASRDDVEIVYPVHLNPNISEPVYDQLSNFENIHLCQPVSYPTMLWLLQRSSLIISDSGGIQEEAPAFSKRVLVTRESSERTEGIEAGFCKLTGTDKAKIVKEANKILNTPSDLKHLKNPYGDGKAAIKIVNILQSLR